MDLTHFYEAVKIAEQNQWNRNYQTPAEVVLDRFFWQALGKGLGWKAECYICGAREEDGHKIYCSRMGWSGIVDKNTWRFYWHRFIDHLADGKDINSFFEEICN